MIGTWWAEPFTPAGSHSRKSKRETITENPAVEKKQKQRGSCLQKQGGETSERSVEEKRQSSAKGTRIEHRAHSRQTGQERHTNKTTALTLQLTPPVL